MHTSVAINGIQLDWDKIKVLRRALVEHIDHSTYIIGSYFEAHQPAPVAIRKRAFAFDLLQMIDGRDVPTVSNSYSHITLEVDGNVIGGDFAEALHSALVMFNTAKSYEQPHLEKLYQYLRTGG